MKRRWPDLRLAAHRSLLKEVPLAVAGALFCEFHLRRGTSLPRLTALLGINLDREQRGEVIGLPAQLWIRRRAVDLVMRHWPVARERLCLRRSLVLGWRLREVGPTLQLGVQHREGGVLAHAWLEVGGIRFDMSDQEYAPLLLPGQR